jgi:hypothetical protein
VKRTIQRCFAEALSARQLLSGGPYITYDSVTRIVTITGAADGANSADVVMIDRVGTNFTYSVDIGNDGATGAYTAQYAVTAVNLVQVRTGDGNDSVTCNSGRSADVQTGIGDDTVYLTRIDSGYAIWGNGGDGDDAIILGQNGSVDLVDGLPSISGGNGYDTIYADDHASAYATYSAFANWIERPGMTRINYAYCDRVVLNLPDVGSTLNIGRVLSYGSIVAVGGAGNDVANIGNSADKLEEIDGPLIFDGNGGNNSINFRDTGITVATTYDITSNSLGRAGMTSVGFSDADVTLLCGSSADTIRANLTTSLDITLNGNANPAPTPDILLLTAPAMIASHQSTSSIDGVWTLPSIGTVTYTNIEEIRSPLLVQSSRFDRDALAVEIDFAGDVGATLELGDLMLHDASGVTIPIASVKWDAANRRGRFALSIPAPPADGIYTATLATTFNDGAASLSAPFVFTFSMLRGDIDLDGTVDFDDLLILAQNYGQSGRTYSQGNIDYSADGLVNFDDLLLLAQRYGSSSAGVGLERKTKRGRNAALLY